jgi:hypothetical protein
MVVSASPYVHENGAYTYQVQQVAEPALRLEGYLENLLTAEVGSVIVRVQANGQWTYETWKNTDLVNTRIR